MMMDDESFDEWVDSDGDTIECFECGKFFYEDAPQCPYCGYLPLSSDRRKPSWTVWVAVLMIMLMALPFLIWLLGIFNF